MIYGPLKRGCKGSWKRKVSAKTFLTNKENEWVLIISCISLKLSGQKLSWCPVIGITCMITRENRTSSFNVFLIFSTSLNINCERLEICHRKSQWWAFLLFFRKWNFLSLHLSAISILLRKKKVRVRTGALNYYRLVSYQTSFYFHV